MARSRGNGFNPFIVLSDITITTMVILSSLFMVLSTLSGYVSLESERNKNAAKELEEKNRQLVAQVGVLRADLEQQKKVVADLTRERDELLAKLNDSRNRVLAIWREWQGVVSQELQSAVGLRPEQISARGSTQHIVLQDQGGEGVLFAKGQAELQPAGKQLIDKIASVLVKHKGYLHQIQVEGHTDDDPIESLTYPSNWELSAARAGAVVHYLLSKKRADVPLIEPWTISANGCAEFHPFKIDETQMMATIKKNPRGGFPLAYVVDANADLSLQQRNRRIEFLLIYKDPGVQSETE